MGNAPYHDDNGAVNWPDPSRTVTSRVPGEQAVAGAASPWCTASGGRSVGGHPAAGKNLSLSDWPPLAASFAPFLPAPAPTVGELALHTLLRATGPKSSNGDRGTVTFAAPQSQVHSHCA